MSVQAIQKEKFPTDPSHSHDQAETHHAAIGFPDPTAGFGLCLWTEMADESSSIAQILSNCKNNLKNSNYQELKKYLISQLISYRCISQTSI